MHHRRTLSITFRGHSLNVKEIARTFDIAPAKSGRRGGAMKAGLPAVFPKDWVKYSFEMPTEYKWDLALYSLMEMMGGEAKISRMIEEYKPDDVEVDLLLAIGPPDNQESGFFSSEALKYLASIGASIGFCFV